MFNKQDAGKRFTSEENENEYHQGTTSSGKASQQATTTTIHRVIASDRNFVGQSTGKNATRSAHSKPK